MSSTIRSSLWLALALVTLIVVGARRGGIFGTVARIALSLLALTFSAVAVGLLVTGQMAHWTSDGPGMLLIMLGLVVSALIALGLWIVTIKSWRRRRPAIEAGPDGGSARPGRSGWTLEDLALVTVVVVGTVAAAWSWVYRPAHESSITGAAFVGDTTRVYSLDAGGLLKVWALQSPPPAISFPDSPYRIEAAIGIPEARNVLDMWVSADGREIALRHSADVTVLQLDLTTRRATVRYRVPGGTRVAAAPAGGFVVGTLDRLFWFAAGSTEPAVQLRGHSYVLGLAGVSSGTAFADGDGVFFVAPGNEPRLLGKPPFPVQQLSFSGDGKAVLVAGLRHDGVAYDVSGGGQRPVEVSFARFARPFAGAFVLVCSPDESCALVDSQSGRSQPAFSGIVHPYDRVDAVSQAALIASVNELFVVSMPKPGKAAAMQLMDRRF
jgi:hypothetical protein